MVEWGNSFHVSVETNINHKTINIDCRVDISNSWDIKSNQFVMATSLFGDWMRSFSDSKWGINPMLITAQELLLLIKVTVLLLELLVLLDG